MKPEHHYPCQIVRVVDGDTVRLLVELGFNMRFEDNFRLARINAPEVRGEQKALGIPSKRFLEDLLARLDLNGFTFSVKSEKHGKFRWLAELYVQENSLNINDHMVEAGMAEYYQKGESNG